MRSMTCSTSFFSSRWILLLWVCLLCGCSGLQPSRPRIVSLHADQASPQPAKRSELLWQVDVIGGTPPFTYEFQVLADNQNTLKQTGPEPVWNWAPKNSGNFQIQVRVKDANGYLTTSDAVHFRIDPVINRHSQIAFFPLENLSGTDAPLVDITNKYKELLQQNDISLVSQERLDAFMSRHRVRYTGGIGAELAHALREEEQVEAVLITSLESYDNGKPPKLALTSRLVLCEEEPEIVWIDGVGLTGEDTPGLLGLKRIATFEPLQQKALGMLIDSMLENLDGKTTQPAADQNMIRPDDAYLASDFSAEQHYKIAVVPFLNRYARRNAGFIIPLNIVKLLQRHPNLEVVEPGLVREQLLKYRLIMQAGPSLAVADVLASGSSLSADLILSGYVFDYQDQFGIPKIDFATRLFSGPKREIIWWSRSIATGDDGVYFFDVGRYRSAHVMLQDMLRAIDQELFPHTTFRPAPQLTDGFGQVHH